MKEQTRPDRMGHPDTPITPITPTALRVDRHKYSRLIEPYVPDDDMNNALGAIIQVLCVCSSTDDLNNALGAIWVLGIELIEHELKPHLNTVLDIIQEKRKGAAEQVVLSGILPILALPLRRRGLLTLLSARLLAELAREPVVCKGFGDAGLVPALISVLTNTDQELLLYAVQAIARMSYESSLQQQQLLRGGAVPHLIGVLLRFPDNGALEGACLLALCNLGDMGELEEQRAWQRAVTPGRPQELVFRGVPRPGPARFGSSVTMVRISQNAPGQYAASIEVFQRCPSSLWKLQASRQRAAGLPFPFQSSRGPGGWAGLLNAVRLSQSSARRESIRTRVFHTFI